MTCAPFCESRNRIKLNWIPEVVHSILKIHVIVSLLSFVRLSACFFSSITPDRSELDVEEGVNSSRPWGRRSILKSLPRWSAKLAMILYHRSAQEARPLPSPFCCPKKIKCGSKEPYSSNDLHSPLVAAGIPLRAESNDVTIELGSFSSAYCFVYSQNSPLRLQFVVNRTKAFPGRFFVAVSLSSESLGQEPL